MIHLKTAKERAAKYADRHPAIKRFAEQGVKEEGLKDAIQEIELELAEARTESKAKRDEYHKVRAIREFVVGAGIGSGRRAND